MIISFVGIILIAFGFVLHLIVIGMRCDTGLWILPVICIVAGIVLILLTAFIPEIIPDALLNEEYIYNVSFTVGSP